MYVPESFREVRPEVLQSLLRDHPFGCLIGHADDGLTATHMPFLHVVEAGGQVLRGHMARANPQWRSFRAGEAVLVVFTGPHGYVSPAWYRSEFAVPTWNYVAVHVTGTPRLVEEPTLVRQLLDDLVAVHERCGWSFS
jgi:transcriptional regulator